CMMRRVERWVVPGMRCKGVLAGCILGSLWIARAERDSADWPHSPVGEALGAVALFAIAETLPPAATGRVLRTRPVVGTGERLWAASLKIRGTVWAIMSKVLVDYVQLVF